MKNKTVGLIINQQKMGAVETGNYLRTRLKELGWQIDQEEADFVLVLGGDGTLLQAARDLAPRGIPVLGINFGQLGFLTEIEVHDLDWALERLAAAAYRIEERMMLEARVQRQGKLLETAIALNDVVVTKGAFARLLPLDIFVNREHVSTIPADGIIVASPTGSTAYSLSAGGAIVPPHLEVLLITPICPHSLTSRPMVVGPEAEVMIRVGHYEGQAMLTVDGQHGVVLEPDDLICVQRAGVRARFIKLTDRTFFQVLRQKLKAGDRCNV